MRGADPKDAQAFEDAVLHTLQRQAVARSACSDTQRDVRRARQRPRAEGAVAVDGFNTLFTLERAVAGGAVLRGRDGAHRDVAGVHGTWRRSVHTGRALDLLVAVLEGAHATVFVDAPVSNSGRLPGLLRDRGLRATLVPSADPVLIEADAVAAALPHVPDAWVVDLGGPW